MGKNIGFFFLNTLRPKSAIDMYPSAKRRVSLHPGISFIWVLFYVTNGRSPGEVSNDVIQTIEKTQGNTHLLPHHNTQFHGIGSLRASSPSDPGEYARASGEAAWDQATFASPLACLSRVYFSRLENLLASYGVDSFFHYR